MTVKIIPPDDGNGELTVETAMRQVLETFQLLNSTGNTAVWRLVSATTNSPFTVVAEADNDIVAIQQKAEFSQNMRELVSGRFPEAWKRPDLSSLASSFLLRSSSERQRIEFFFEEGEAPLALEADVAATFEGLPGLFETPTLMPFGIKKQIGSIDGTLTEVITYRGKAAIRLRERKTKRDITCVIPEQLVGTFSSQATMQDVWMHRRLTVRGMLLYQASGSILRVEASRVDAGNTAPQHPPSLRDPNFTGGLSAAEYLERFRAGELG